MRRLPQALELAALELREDRRRRVDLGQSEAEEVEGVHLQHDERAAMLAEMQEDVARLHPSATRKTPFASLEVLKTSLTTTTNDR